MRALIGRAHQNSFGYAAGFETGSAHPRSSGFIGGGQIGYNWQAGNFVYGLEGDISGLGGHQSANVPDGKVFSNKITWLSTVRARAGVLVDPSTMLYVTGGLAVGGVHNSLQVRPGFLGFAKSESTTRVGWTAGGGVEHMLSNSHWTVALEGLVADLGSSSATAVGTTTGTAKTAHFSNRTVIGRVKLNYKF